MDTQKAIVRTGVLGTARNLNVSTNKTDPKVVKAKARDPKAEKAKARDARVDNQINPRPKRSLRQRWRV